MEWSEKRPKMRPGNSLVIQWLGLGAFTARAFLLQSSIPGGGTKIPQALWHSHTHTKQILIKKKSRRPVRGLREEMAEAVTGGIGCEEMGDNNWYGEKEMNAGDVEK